ncbi:MAG: TIGR02186 family protein [Micavibrio aeruginosavorus]|nr:TIGR02186 family protein [Micavibrio aeruginosavorus]
MMLRFCLIIAALVMLSSGAAQAQRLLMIDLAEKAVDITTGFDGSRLVVYGTKRAEGDIAVTVRGPAYRMVVRRKDRVLGLWMNRKAVSFEEVPAYYDMALSRREADLAPADVLRRYDIGLDALRFETREEVATDVSDAFREAMIRNRQTEGLFPLEPRPIVFMDDGFFRANFYLPANVPTGVYKVRAFLIRDGVVQDSQETEIKVAQTGFSAEVYLFSLKQSLAYGVLAVMMALFFGWGAYVILRRE